MNKIIILIAVTTLFVSCDFRNPENIKSKESIGTAYGNPFDYSASIPAAELFLSIGNSGIDTVMNGKISSICEDKKCLMLGISDSSTILVNWDLKFKIEDDASGKNVFARGTAYRDTTNARQFIFKATGLVVY